ncbi:MAG: Mur ligase domain-containing protein, partial [Planctomycetota bacterium]|nr:Mur ligase domain-containing protein [Planctomycetota bacterium]
MLSNHLIDLPPPPSHLHLIGIGGTGMSNLAFYFSSQGYKISGSDLLHTPTTEHLNKKGIKVFYGHRPSNLPKKTVLVIKSSAIKDENPEIKEAKRRNIPANAGC